MTRLPGPGRLALLSAAAAARPDRWSWYLVDVEVKGPHAQQQQLVLGVQAGLVTSTSSAPALVVVRFLVCRFVLSRCGPPPAASAASRCLGTGPAAHEAGTVRFGSDPATSVLNPDCRAHELDNLYVADTSIFPSISAVNPALTAMANAVRVGDHPLQRLG
jgi:choline dehydrogenase-like flavoprotein